MSRPPSSLVIDARPRGPRGPLAVEPVQGRSVLEHLLDLAARLDDGGATTLVFTRPEDQTLLEPLVASTQNARLVLAEGEPAGGVRVLRTDRLYDPARLGKALRRGQDPESAVIWRLDVPHALAGAADELVRRQSFQPIGRYWALAPARRLARALAPTRVRPNAVTLLAGALVLGAAVVVAFAPAGTLANVLAASALAIALVLDTADGHLARLQGTSSAFGRWLDGWLDEVGDMALHAAIAWSAFTRTGQVFWLLFGMLYAMGKFVFVAGTSSGDEPGSSGKLITPLPESLATRCVRLAGHADVRWHLWIVLAAAGRLDAALVAYAFYFPARSVLVAARKAVRRG
jgi:phosphatidylglycerophosphate synthase